MVHHDIVHIAVLHSSR